MKRVVKSKPKFWENLKYFICVTDVMKKVGEKSTHLRSKKIQRIIKHNGNCMAALKLGKMRAKSIHKRLSKMQLIFVDRCPRSLV